MTDHFDDVTMRRPFGGRDRDLGDRADGRLGGRCRRQDDDAPERDGLNYEEIKVTVVDDLSDRRAGAMFGDPDVLPADDGLNYEEIKVTVIDTDDDLDIPVELGAADGDLDGLDGV